MTNLPIRHPRARRRLLAAALLAAALSAPVPVLATGAAGDPPRHALPPAATSATGSYLAGRFAQQHDDWAAAAQFMGHALAADPEDVALLRRTHMLKLGGGDLDTAVTLAGRLAERQVTDQIALTLLIGDHLKQGRADAARELAARMPRDGLARYVAPLADAWLAAAAGRTDDALAALQPLGSAAGFAALYDLHAALVLDLGGKADAAAEHYARVAAAEPPLRVVQIAGNFYERTGRRDEARALYTRFADAAADATMIEPALKALDDGATPAALVGDPTQGLAEALFDLGSALHHEGAAETALLFGRIALHLRPDLALARLMIGDIMDDRGHHAAALDEYATLEDSPVIGWPVRMRMAEALAGLKRHDEAIARYTALAAERPSRLDPLVRLGDLYRSMKRYDDAVDAYTRALERAGTPALERHWPIHYARAMAYDQTGRWPLAEADLEAALTLRPDEPYLLNYLGYTWVDKGINLERARKMIERAVELRPKDGYIIDSLGWALYRMGEYEEAVVQLERAVELRPVDPTINDHLGDAYWQVGRSAEARFQWQRALRTAESDEERETIRAKLDKGLPARRAAQAEPR
ncbi:tetratricopeptide repeat protein [Azospirillum halopraeferens]|uniref:tetratricopeptide repeat protein n=1 Tax=Azospirillum halopraeferens TaxID=34010 RepID=UPI000400DFF7|nr:tetratricopeptide repeat protein [Azospirillum halopraeferens]